MKVALCLSGIVGGSKTIGGGGSHGPDIHPGLGRHFWGKAVLDHYDTDVFIHSWSEEWSDIIKETYNPTLSKFETQKRWVPPSGEWLEEYNHPLSTLEDLSNDRRYSHLPAALGEKTFDNLRFFAERSRSRWYGNKKAMELKHQYEKDNNFRYDFVIMGRFDIWFQEKFPLDALEKGCFYASPRTNGDKKKMKDYDYALQDIWFLGDSDLMDKFYSLYDYVSEYAIESPKAAWEHMSRFIGADKLRFLWKFHDEYQILRWKFSEEQLNSWEPPK